MLRGGVCERPGDGDGVRGGSFGCEVACLHGLSGGDVVESAVEKLGGCVCQGETVGLEDGGCVSLFGRGSFELLWDGAAL